MPLLIAFALLIEVCAQYPALSGATLVALVLGIGWKVRKTGKVARLTRQIYLDDVAAFAWREDMPPTEFETRCATALHLAGWTAQTTKKSGDQGVDVLAERNGVRIVLQCKLYSKAVGNSAVQEAYSAKAFAKARYAAVVTNAGFTKAAKELSDHTGVMLLHFSELARPSHLFGLPEVEAPRRPSGVTYEDLHRARQSIPHVGWVLGLLALFIAAASHDQPFGSRPSNSPDRTISSLPAEGSSPSASSASTTMPPSQGGEAAETSLPRSHSPAASIVRHTDAGKPAGARSTFATLRPGDIFCESSSDFDRHWNWSIAGNQTREPATPTCKSFFMSPVRVEKLRRLGTNKTEVKISDGDMAGRIGYTDAFIP